MAFGSSARSSNASYLSFKMLGLIGMLSYHFLYAVKNNIAAEKAMRILYIIRVLSSSLVYSLIAFDKVSFDFHIECLVLDSIFSAFFFVIMILAFPLSYKSSKENIFLHLSLDAILFTITMLIFLHFTIFPFIFQGGLAVLLLGFDENFAHRNIVTLKKVEECLKTNSEEIKTELEEIRKKMEEENKLTDESKHLSIDHVDRIVTKIKYLKFSLVQDEQERKMLTKTTEPPQQFKGRKQVHSRTIAVNPSKGIESRRNFIRVTFNP
jgi:hypothetical protein